MKTKEYIPKQGDFFLNFTDTAEPIADCKLKETILKRWALVSDGAQIVQLNVCNEIAIDFVRALIYRGKIDGSRVYYMTDNVIHKVKHYKQDGAQIPNLQEVTMSDPDWSKLPKRALTLLNEIFGI